MPQTTQQTLLELDHAHVWHPYSSFESNVPIYPVSHAQECTLHLTDGRSLIDGMSSWWSAIHGYNHPKLNQAVIDQTSKMAHVMFGGLTHEPAVRLCQTLVELTPEGLDHVFLADSGSVSVEVALKMALQYWMAQAQPNKRRFLALRKAYHGDTFGAMSVCDPITGMHHLFKGALQENVFAESPSGGYSSDRYEQDIVHLKALIQQHHSELAALIVEPIVQGAGGMNFYSPHYLRAAKALCEEYNLLFIADEIATGFGRTGTLFGCDHAAITPDIMCLGKALTGGYMTLAATLCTAEVAQSVCHGPAGVFMHGPTFMGNPLACAVANASITLLVNSPWQQRIAQIEAQLRVELERCTALETVEDVRVLGAIGVVELKSPVDMSEIMPLLVDAGIWIRPFGKLVYTMPPFIIQPDELSKITGGIRDVLSRLR